MSSREQVDPAGLERMRLDHILDDRALRILTDGHRHQTQAVAWALQRNPLMASFTSREMALGAYDVYRG